MWLGDEPSETGRRKWRIPDLTFVAGQGFALFYTGSGTSQPSVFLFDLAAAGEYLRLSQNDSSTTAVDALSFGPSAPDQSQGRLPDGSAATGGMVPSPGASNTAVPAPAFITPPASTAAVAGGSVILSATPLNYLGLQWRKNGSPIPGAVDATLQLNSLTAGDEADYTLAATSAAGTAVSRPAHLTVLYTWQAWAAQYGLTSLSGDNDADGMDNATEFLSGGNPLAAGSLAGGIAGGSDTLSGQRYFTLDYTLSRRAAFSSLTGQRSNNLTLWSDESPAGSEILSTQPNGDTRLRVRFPWAAGSGREFLRLKLTP